MVHRDGSLVGGKSSVLAVLRYESVVSCEILHISTVVACDHMQRKRVAIALVRWSGLTNLLQ